MSTKEYIKGQWYENGRYIGVFDTYPWGEDYFIRNHHFMEAIPKGNAASSVANVFVEKINRD